MRSTCAARQNARTDALGDQPVARQRTAFGTLAEVVVIGDEWRAVDVDMLSGSGHHLRPVVFPMEAVLVRRWDSRQLVSPAFRRTSSHNCRRHSAERRWLTHRSVNWPLLS